MSFERNIRRCLLAQLLGCRRFAVRIAKWVSPKSVVDYVVLLLVYHICFRTPPSPAFSLHPGDSVFGRVWVAADRASRFRRVLPLLVSAVHEGISRLACRGGRIPRQGRAVQFRLLLGNVSVGCVPLHWSLQGGCLPITIRREFGLAER